MGILGGGGLGGLLNSITGASQSARQQNQYAVGMSKLNYAQQKDMLLNGPSWQMEGYDKAGVNPTYGLGGLHQGGGTATGSGGGGGGIAALTALSGIYNDTRATDADVGLKKAEAEASLINAKANMTSAKANNMNAVTNAKSGKAGVAGRFLGNDYNIEKGIKGWKNTFSKLFGE